MHGLVGLVPPAFQLSITSSFAHDVEIFDEAKDIDIRNTFGNLEKETNATGYFLIYRCSQQGEQQGHPF